MPLANHTVKRRRFAFLLLGLVPGCIIGYWVSTLSLTSNVPNVGGSHRIAKLEAGAQRIMEKNLELMNLLARNTYGRSSETRKADPCTILTPEPHSQPTVTMALLTASLASLLSIRFQLEPPGQDVETSKHVVLPVRVSVEAQGHHRANKHSPQPLTVTLTHTLREVGCPGHQIWMYRNRGLARGP